MLSSRFTFGAWLIPLLFTLLTTICVGVGITFWEKTFAAPFGAFVFVTFFAFVEIWLFWGEFRTKVIRIRLDESQLTLRRFGGLGPETTYDWKQLDGYQTAILPAQQGTYEYLYLLQDGKKVIKLSQFYHRNYPELKVFVERRVANKGMEPFSYWQELKEIFQ